jgi:hypothetical protein
MLIPVHLQYTFASDTRYNIQESRHNWILGTQDNDAVLNNFKVGTYVLLN